MLQLKRGSAMRLLVTELDRLGFTWAYRVVDTRAFGLPQRRRRVILLASRTEDPRGVLFAGDEKEPNPPDPEAVACAFYWTEGLKGLGWAVDAVPTLKGGSTVGIPSPPAIRMPGSRSIVTPDIRDVERLQGFPVDWTLPASSTKPGRQSVRWKLVGNAVSVPVSRWVAEGLTTSRSHDASADRLVTRTAPWPKAAWGRAGRIYQVDRGPWPMREEHPPLAAFLEFPVTPLSARATAGFLNRANRSRLRFIPSFLDDVRAHLERVRGCA
jgi:DNA (cytosine-5)-methyltransferase 1